MYNVLTKCPVCGGELKVTKLECTNCNSRIEGDFKLSKFNYLSDEQLKFALVFLKNAGNIKAVEKELDISYPTVKKNLDELIEALGFSKVDIKEEVTEYNNRKDVLAALKDNRISYEETKKILAGMEE